MVMISPLLTGLLLAPAVFGAAVPRAGPVQHARRQVAPHPTLRPIRPAQLSALMDARTAKRDAPEIDAEFGLADKEELLYGLPGGPDSFVMANVTLLSTDGRPLINMERFEGSTKSVQCGEKMTLEFVSKAAFESAVAAWGWVNEDETHEFIMIANHEGCSPADQRTPYQIINADYDEETFTATLDAKVAIWKDIAETFTLDFGKVQLPPMSLQGDVSAAISYDDSVSIDLTQSVRNPVIFQTSSAASGFDLTVSCLDCGTRGTLDVKGHVRVEWFKVTELTVEASPENVEARLHLGVKVQGNSAVSFTKELFSVGLGGFNIPGIFTLGPTLDYEVGFSSTLNGVAELSYGVLAKISNDAIIKADLINPKNSQFHGWEPTIQQIPFKLNAVAKASVTVFSQPVLALTIDVIGLPAYEAALKMKLPQLTANLIAVSSSVGNGVCGDKSKTTGVQIGADIGVDLTFRVGEDTQDGSGTLYQTQLFAYNRHLFDTCLAF